MVITIQIQDKQDFNWIAPFLESIKMNAQAKVEIREVPNSSKSDKTGELPDALQHIAAAIEESKSMLALAEDWDDDEALPIKEVTFKRASRFLGNYSKWLFDNFKVVIEAPQLSPGPDGSVDMLWRTKHYRMLLNIPQNENQQVGYYGDDYKDGNSIKGKVPAEGVKEYLALWLKALKQ